METCKYGSGAGKRKPTAVKRKGVVCRAYVLPTTKSVGICRYCRDSWEKLKKSHWRHNYETRNHYHSPRPYCGYSIVGWDGMDDGRRNRFDFPCYGDKRRKTNCKTTCRGRIGRTQGTNEAEYNTQRKAVYSRIL